jgi:citrate lyase subunit beta/citryl-CoA lyase
MTPGTAGRRGEDVRSDLEVRVEPRSEGGIELSVASRVEPYYGEAIRVQVREILAALGVTDAAVAVDDSGALPFVIQARVEAAVRRASTGSAAGAERDARPERTAPKHASAPRDRLRRSRLYLPGNEPKFMLNAGLHRPDGVILDLEDSVHPREKDAARLLVRNALRVLDFGASERMVRINPFPLGADDLEAVVPESPDLLLLPKIESAEQVAEIAEATARVAKRAGTKDGPWLMPILESALGVERAFEIARASARVVALTIGLEDYTADLGVPKTSAGDESAWARGRLVTAAKAAGVQAIDSVYGDVGDVEGLERWALRSRGMGFEGMGCVHPRQIRVIHEAFAPSRNEIDRAREIEAAFRDAEANGLAVVSLGSKMIDPPVVHRARKLVEQARSMGLLPKEGA